LKNSEKKKINFWIRILHLKFYPKLITLSTQNISSRTRLNLWPSPWLLRHPSHSAQAKSLRKTSSWRTNNSSQTTWADTIQPGTTRRPGTMSANSPTGSLPRAAAWSTWIGSTRCSTASTGPCLKSRNNSDWQKLSGKNWPSWSTPDPLQTWPSLTASRQRRTCSATTGFYRQTAIWVCYAIEFSSAQVYMQW